MSVWPSGDFASISEEAEPSQPPAPAQKGSEAAATVEDVKSRMEISELENTVTKVEGSVSELSGRMRGEGRSDDNAGTDMRLNTSLSPSRREGGQAELKGTGEATAGTSQPLQSHPLAAQEAEGTTSGTNPEKPRARLQLLKTTDEEPEEHHQKGLQTAPLRPGSQEEMAHFSSGKSHDEENPRASRCGVRSLQPGSHEKGVPSADSSLVPAVCLTYAEECLVLSGKPRRFLKFHFPTWISKAFGVIVLKSAI